MDQMFEHETVVVYMVRAVRGRTERAERYLKIKILPGRLIYKSSRGDQGSGLCIIIIMGEARVLVHLHTRGYPGTRYTKVHRSTQKYTKYAGTPRV